MGKVCLGFILLWALQARGEEILLPPTPKMRPPPARSKEASEEDFKRKQEYMKSISNDTKLEDQPPEVQKERKLLEETVKQRPFDFGLAMALLVPYPKVTGPRKNYGLDPSAELLGFYRLTEAKSPGDWTVWTGGRVAFFNGYGVYDNIPGNFSFVYFGPTIGLGKFSPPPQDLPANIGENKRAVDELLSGRGGWIVQVGIAAQNRHVRTAKGTEGEGEFTSKGIAFDSPGFWAEAIYFRVYYGALSLQGVGGMQLGKGKTFLYAGFGVGGFY